MAAKILKFPEASRPRKTYAPALVRAAVRLIRRKGVKQ